MDMELLYEGTSAEWLDCGISLGFGELTFLTIELRDGENGALEVLNVLGDMAGCWKP